MSERIAHSAEHAFIGSLQKILGRTLDVRKVEHMGKKNTAYVVDDQLSLDAVLKAENMVNSLIRKGARIFQQEFASLEDARNSISSLRANEKRIVGRVRVIEIEGHDYAACNRDHSSDIRECDFFLVTGLTKDGNECRVDFAVANYAKEEARRISTILLSICSELGANLNTIEETVKKLRAQTGVQTAKLRSITEQQLGHMQTERIGDITLSVGSFANLEDRQILESVSRLIEREATIVIITNTFGESADIILAKSNRIACPDLRVIFQNCPVKAKGGGTSDFVCGVIDAKTAESFVDSVVATIRTTLRVG